MRASTGRSASSRPVTAIARSVARRNCFSCSSFDTCAGRIARFLHQGCGRRLGVVDQRLFVRIGILTGLLQQIGPLRRDPIPFRPRRLFRLCRIALGLLRLLQDTVGSQPFARR